MKNNYMYAGIYKGYLQVGFRVISENIVGFISKLLRLSLQIQLIFDL